MSGGWAGSSRRAELPPDWPRRCEAVRERDQHRCTWRDRGQRCTAGIDQVDHIDRFGGHELVNLRGLCGPHHGIKSSAEGNAARWPASRRRPLATHPGLT